MNQQLLLLFLDTINDAKTRCKNPLLHKFKRTFNQNRTNDIKNGMLKERNVPLESSSEKPLVGKQEKKNLVFLPPCA